MDKSNAVNERIKEVRLSLGLSQAAFSTGLHLRSSGYISNIEVGKKAVNSRIIELVCSVYGVSKDWLTTGEGEMFAKESDKLLAEMTVYFNQLNPDFKSYVLKQIKELLKLQHDEK
jgi:transcriptional regulator with XRE-family HTH domain